VSSGRSLLVALRGMPGIGKSVLARAVGGELGWPVLDKDDIKDVLAGRTDRADELAYDLLFHLAHRQLRQGLSVICDSPLMHPGLYALAGQTAQASGAALVVLDCVVPDVAEHQRRLETRGAGDPTRTWRVNDWQGFITYRARTLPHAGYAIAAPRHLVDLTQPSQLTAHETATWLRGLAEPGY